MEYFVVDAFSDKVFAGNPACVCVLKQWLPDRVMTQIASENNLSETAFLIRQQAGTYEIRWFTPVGEFDLCGHATLASAFVVVNLLEPGLQTVRFDSMSGKLAVNRVGERYELDFPSRPPERAPDDGQVERALGVKPLALYRARDHVALLERAQDVRALKPDFAQMAQIEDCIGLVVTAPGEDCDFVSRYFSPHDVILEDPVTGSAHCTLIPFWAQRLGKRELVARQLSARGGTLYCKEAGDRVRIAGSAVLFARGKLMVGDGQ